MRKLGRIVIGAFALVVVVGAVASATPALRSFGDPTGPTSTTSTGLSGASGETGPRNRFPFFVCHDWREWLVKLAAHEAKHIEQFRNRAICSELSCERFALERLDEFRALAVAEPPVPFSPPRPVQLALPGI